MGAQSKTLAWQAPVVLTFQAGPNAALLTAPDVALWLADADAEIVFASEIHETLGTDAGAVTVDVVKAANGTAVGAGTTLLTSTFNLKAAINTRQTRKLSAAGIAADRIIYNGQTLGINFTGVLTSVTGVHITVVLQRLRRPSW